METRGNVGTGHLGRVAAVAAAAGVLALSLGACGVEGSGPVGGGGASDGSASGGLPATVHEHAVREGHAFRFGDFEVLEGWRIGQAPLLRGYNIGNMRVKDVSGGRQTFGIEVRLYGVGKKPIATIDCATGFTKVGSAPVSADCVPETKPKKKFSRITVASLF